MQLFFNRLAVAGFLLSAPALFAAENPPGAAAAPNGAPPSSSTQSAPGTSDIRQVLQQFNEVIQEQARQLKEQRQELEEQRKELEGLRNRVEQRAGATASSPTAAAAELRDAAYALTTNSPASNQASIRSGLSHAVPQVTASTSDQESPLYVKIGNARFTPGGWADFTSIFRTADVGSGLGTSFASIPFSNTVQGGLTESRFSAQSSRF
jgi:DNA-binding transcriptional MerR regulator